MSAPTNNPGKCERCKSAYHSDGKALDIHWSLAAQQWLCFICNSKVPQEYP